MNRPIYQFEMSVADSLVNVFCELDVQSVFGVPGGAIEPLLNALAEHSDVISFIHSRHESGAAYMAHGYSLASGKISVCCATTGPGATNLITGVSAAFLDHVPMVVITGQNAHIKTGRPSLQDSTSFGIDTVEIFKRCTKFSANVPSADVFPTILAKALQQALTPPYGPVHLSIPTDVMKATVKRPASRFLNNTMRFRESPLTLCSLLSEKRIALYIGRRALAHQSELNEFINTQQIPFVCSPQGKAVIHNYLGGCAGVFGFCGHDSASELLDAADVVLAIGANMEELSTNGWSSNLCNTKLYCISDDPDDLNRSYGLANVFDVDVSDTIKMLSNTQLKPWGQKYASPYLSSNLELLGVKNHPATMLNIIFTWMHGYFQDAYIEAGNSWCWYLHYVAISKAFIEANFGAMGWAIGAGIGSCAYTKKRTIVISGDGSFLMNGCELSTAVEQDLPVLFVVLNDGGLGMVRHGQRLSNSASVGHKFPVTSYADMARAMGAAAVSVKTESELEEFDWSTIKKRPGPFLLELMVNAEIEPPMGRRIESLMKQSVALSD